MRFLTGGDRDGGEECERARQGEESRAVKQSEGGSVK